MLKLIIRNKHLYARLYKKRAINSFLIYDVSRLHLIEDTSVFESVTTQIRMINGTYKTTSSGRFEDVDSVLMNYLEPGKTYKIHDIAVSDGVTSLELMQRLNDKGVDFEILLSDKYPAIYCRKKSWMKTYRDLDGNILFLDVLGILVSKHLSNRFFLSRLFGHLVADEMKPKDTDQRVLLLNREVSRLLEMKQIRFSEYDVFQGDVFTPGTFDVCRCMNLLTLNYFKEEELMEGIMNIYKSMKEGGILVLGQTNKWNFQNTATIYQKSHGQMKALTSVNHTIEIDNLVRSLREGQDG